MSDEDRRARGREATRRYRAKQDALGIPRPKRVRSEEANSKHRERMRAWRAANPELYREQSRASRERNAERLKEQRLAWEKANPDYDREWNARNAERVKAQKAAWRAANPDIWRTTSREWRRANRDRIKEMTRAWAEANPEKVTEYRARRRARYAGAPVIEKIDRAALIARDKSRCHICGKRVAKREITLDHIVPLAAGGEHTARNLAVAHRSCNAAKGARAANDQLRLVG